LTPALRRGDFAIPYVQWQAGGAARPPAILLLHGLSSNARYWDRVASHLTTRRRVALDLTPANPADAAMSELIESIAFAIAELDLGRPVVVGHSWGAALALEFVVAHPELTSGFVFVDGPIHGVSRIFTWEEVEAIMQPPFRHYATAAEAIAESRRYLGSAWADDLEPYVEAGLMRDEEGLVSKLTSPVRLRILRDIHDSDPERLWPAISVPAAALIARKSDARISRSTDEGMARVAEIAPAVAIKRFETPHDIPLYAPLEVAREIELIAERAESASPLQPAAQPSPGPTSRPR
jgi:pimeloyl-ACP methyl ester carboxylesterase